MGEQHYSFKSPWKSLTLPCKQDLAVLACSGSPQAHFPQENTRGTILTTQNQTNRSVSYCRTVDCATSLGTCTQSTCFIHKTSTSTEPCREHGISLHRCHSKIQAPRAFTWSETSPFNPARSTKTHHTQRAQTSPRSMSSTFFHKLSLNTYSTASWVCSDFQMH